MLAGLLVTVLAALWMPAFVRDTETQNLSAYGGIVSGGTVMGYVVIGLLSILLGVSVTLLCLHLRGEKDEERQRHE